MTPAIIPKSAVKLYVPGLVAHEISDRLRRMEAVCPCDHLMICAGCRASRMMRAGIQAQAGVRP